MTTKELIAKATRELDQKLVVHEKHLRAHGKTKKAVKDWEKADVRFTDDLYDLRKAEFRAERSAFLGACAVAKAAGYLRYLQRQK